MQYELIAKLKFAIVILILFSSCSIEKRHYNAGYYLDWKKEYRSDQDPSVKEKFKINTAEPETGFQADLGNEPVFSTLSGNLLELDLQFKNSKDEKCDIIVLLEGTEIKARIRKVGQRSIYYKNCDGDKNGFYAIEKSKVFVIHNADGKTDTINDKIKLRENLSASSDSLQKNDREEKIEPNAEASFTLGLLSLLFSPLGLAAIVLGIISLGKIKRSEGKLQGKDKAIAGIIIGSAVTFLVLLSFLFILAFLRGYWS